MKAKKTNVYAAYWKNEKDIKFCSLIVGKDVMSAISKFAERFVGREMHLLDIKFLEEVNAKYDI